MSTPHFPFDNSYARLPERFYARVAPTPVAKPSLMLFNDALATELGLDPQALRTEDGVAVLAGNAVPDGAEPLAMAYAGHQFANWVPQLGDGRALLLGELRGTDGVAYDVQLKGSGPTPFSRRGDGRNWIGPVLREFLLSEAMHQLGVPTTRALAAVRTGEPIRRERLLPGGIVTRVARTHLRVGTFQYFAAREDTEALRTLVDYAIARLAPELATAERPALALLEHVARRQAHLIAQWMRVGFVHGVMNTDNSSISGETLDYGPAAFLDTFSRAKVFSSIDRTGRYAFGNQPSIGQWNLAVLAQALLPLIHDDENQALTDAQAVVYAFPTLFAAEQLAASRAKLGLSAEVEGDDDLFDELLDQLESGQADFTRAFRALCDLPATASPGSDAAFFAELPGPSSIDGWLRQWRQRLATEGSDDATRQAAMRRANPAVIPRNHRIEEAIRAAEDGDLQPAHTLHRVLATPYHLADDDADYALAPAPEQVVRQTFCGT